MNFASINELDTNHFCTQQNTLSLQQILTKKAFENAITVVMALGGSTNAVLHLLAIAHEADVDLTLEDFQRVGAKVPLLGDLKPFLVS